MDHIATKKQQREWMLHERCSPACGVAVQTGYGRTWFNIESFVEAEDPCPACTLLTLTDPELFFATVIEVMRHNLGE